MDAVFDIAAVPRDLPQFGKSLANLQRTSDQVYGTPGGNGGSAGNGCSCNGSGCGCSQCVDGEGAACATAEDQTMGRYPESVGKFESNAIATGPWHGDARQEYLWYVMGQIHRFGSYRGEDLGCGEMTMITVAGEVAKRCEDLSSILETADCAAMNATCPVERGAVWICGEFYKFECGCFNIWRVMPEGRRMGYPTGSFGVSTPGEDVPSVDDDGKKHGGCSWKKESKCACHCWFPKFDQPPDYPRGQAGRNVPCDRLGKKDRSAWSRASNAVYPSPFGWS
jgi:hypothetical protein